MEPVITVGLDGSSESMAAARWAADEAERRKLALRLLHAWPMLAPEPPRVPAEIDQNYWAKRLVHSARAELQARHPGLSVVGNLIADDAQDALLKAASESEMTVLGSRGLESVESSLEPWREKFPAVEVTDSIGVESPAKTVVRSAEDAGLLVVGRRRRRPALAPRLGPVAQAALHHARCPVAVVPHD
ncbi:universal stress protein [Streptomyces sp. NPDC097617]|uniref:universal stress protein n=1 Tax=Streptomyces sp. NPDC097617 TaxID=3366091 RepID=UPI0038231071